MTAGEQLMERGRKDDGAALFVMIIVADTGLRAMGREGPAALRDPLKRERRWP